MFGFARKSVAPAAASAVQLYFSEDVVIVAATHRNLAGIYFEQAGGTVRMAGVPSAHELGQAFQAAFRSFSMMEADLRNAKGTDWPAFKASGARSIRQFNDTFRTVSCYSLNPSNAIVRASTPHARNSEIELSTSFNPLMSAEIIGAQLLRLLEVAKAM